MFLKPRFKVVKSLVLNMEKLDKVLNDGKYALNSKEIVATELSESKTFSVSDSIFDPVETSKRAFSNLVVSLVLTYTSPYLEL